MTPSQSLRDFGHPVAFYPGLVKRLGGVNATLFFCQLFFHTGKEDNPSLGIYKTAEEMQAETGLTREEQRTARKHLRDRGILIETERRLEHRIYYRLNLDAFDAAPTPESGKPNAPSVNPQPPLGLGPTVIQEITTEKTQEKKPLHEAAPRALPNEKHTPFREAFDTYFRHRNAGMPAPWDPKEAAQLSRWLKANPTVSLEQWRTLLNNRARAPVNHALALSAWISKAFTWINAPLDEYGRDHGDRKASPSKASQNLAALQEALARTEPASQPEPHGYLAAGGGGRRNTPTLLLGPPDRRPAGGAGGAGELVGDAAG